MFYEDLCFCDGEGCRGGGVGGGEGWGDCGDGGYDRNVGGDGYCGYGVGEILEIGRVLEVVEYFY